MEMDLSRVHAANRGKVGKKIMAVQCSEEMHDLCLGQWQSRVSRDARQQGPDIHSESIICTAQCCR